MGTRLPDHKDASQAEEFFNLLWPAGLPDGGHLVLGIKGERKLRSEFYTDLPRAAKRAVDAGSRADVYMGMAAQPRVQSGRGTTDTAIAIPGLWLDLDFSKGFNDLAGVRRFLSALPLQPSLLVSSGGGVHAHWLFETWLPAPGGKAAALELGWLRYCRQVAQLELKAELDMVADLARVLRVPGTSNFKRDQPTPVVTLDYDGNLRYDPEQFSSWQADVRSRTAASSTATIEFSLREDAQPPYEKWTAAIENLPEIKKVYDHQKKMENDNSLSGYDMSLATRLDALNWTAQEIVDTIITHRRKWANDVTDPDTSKDPLHLEDRSYYERLLRKARLANDRDRSSREVVKKAEEIEEELSDQGDDTPPNELRVRWMSTLSEIVGIEIVDLWAVDSIEGAWHLRIRSRDEMRDIVVGTPDRLLQWQFWKQTIMVSGVSVDSIPKKEPAILHPLVCRAGMMLRVTGDGQGARAIDELASYLLETAQSAPTWDKAAIIERQAFRKVDGGPLGIASWGQPEECLFIRPDSMHFDVKNGLAPRLPNIRHALISLGFVKRTVGVRGDEKLPTTSRYYYALPVARLRTAVKRTVSDEQDLSSGPGVDDGDEGRIH